MGNNYVSFIFFNFNNKKGKMEAAIANNEIILPEGIKMRSKKAEVIQTEDLILMMPHERESLRG